MRCAKGIVVGLLLAACVLAACTRKDDAIRIGSKNFTESLVLAEILRLQTEKQGAVVTHRRALGGSAILWKALQDGSIDVYPEYTGTLTQELLRGLPADASMETIAAQLRPLGIGISAPIGFEDRYALALSERAAQQLSDTMTLGALHEQPLLRYGLSSEFMRRADGWPALQRAYGLNTSALRGLDHDLAYRALAADEIDVVDVYTTDAEIPYYRLRVLADDRHVLPPQTAVWLYRLDTAQRRPALTAAMAALAGRIDEARMQSMNADVKLHGQADTQVAAAFLGLERATVADDAPWRRIARHTLEHLWLVGLSLGAAILLGLPLGIVAARSRPLARIALSVTSVLQTIPSLAMFVFLIPLLGIGAKPAIVALSLYGLLPIVRNTVTGLTGIDPALRDSALALGLPARVRLLRIELPLAARTILAGLSTAAIIDVGTATLGALIGAGGYGEPIITGIRLDDVGLILEGAVPAALMALAVQALFSLLDRRIAADSPHPGAARGTA